MFTSFADAFNQIAEKVKPKKDFIIGPDSINYGQYVAQVENSIGYFHTLGLKPGDRIVVSCQHDVETAVLYMAALCAGVTIVVIDPEASTAEAILLLHAADPKIIFIDESKAENLLQASTDKNIHIIRIRKPSSFKKSFGLLRLNKKTTDAPTSYPEILTQDMASSGPIQEYSNNQTALILFTSGTTSRPKGVELSYSNLLVQLQIFIEQFELDSNSVILNHLPLHHTDGLNQGVLMAFFVAATWLKPETVSMQNLDELLYSIQRHQVTHFVSVPSVLAMIMRLPDDVDDCLRGKQFKFIESTAGYLEEKLWSDFETRFACQIVNCYGLTETVSEAIYCGPDRSSRKLGTIGKPIGCETRIVDALGNEVATGEMGELTLRGEIVMNGYFRNEDATNEVMKDGWFYTGDLAAVDDEGFLSIVGRKKNVIIRGGINIYPEDITDTVAKIEGVLGVVTIGMPDPLLGEKVITCVSPDGTIDLSPHLIINHCRNNLAPEKIPNEVLFFQELPRGPSGKVELGKVKGMAENMLSMELPDSTGSETQQIFQMAANIFKVDSSELNIDSRYNSTQGWDSLAHLEFVMSLEKNFGVSFSPREVMNIQSLGDAVDLINKYELSG